MYHAVTCHLPNITSQSYVSWHLIYYYLILAPLWHIDIWIKIVTFTGILYLLSCIITVTWIYNTHILLNSWNPDLVMHLPFPWIDNYIINYKMDNVHWVGCNPLIPDVRITVYLADITTVYAPHRMMVRLHLSICMFISITSPLDNIFIISNWILLLRHDPMIIC